MTWKTVGSCYSPFFSSNAFNAEIYFDNQTVILTALGIWGILVITYLFYLIKKYAYCKKDLQQITKLPYDLPNEQGISKRRSNTKVSLFAISFIILNLPLKGLANRVSIFGFF